MNPRTGAGTATSGASGTVGWRALGAAMAAYAAIAVALTWPLAASLTTTIPADVGDPVLNTWILWWNSVKVPLTSAWWNAPAFFPAEGVLAFSEHLLGLSPIATPVILATGSPVAGYNVTFLLTFVLSATAAFALIAVITGRLDAAFLAGVAFGFSPYRVAQWSHLQVLAAFWIPVALIALHRYHATARPRWLLVLAAALVAQSLTNAYYLVFLPVLVALWCLWFLGTAWRRIAAVLATGAAAMLVLSPLLLEYQRVHARYGLTRNVEQMRMYSADVLSIVTSSPHLALWPELAPARNNETALFPGFAVLALCAIGAGQLGRRRAPAAPGDLRLPATHGRTLAFYLLAAAATYALALGPSPRLFGDQTLGWSPYAWLAEWPGFESLRAPARFGMLTVGCLAIAAALAFARATVRLGTGTRRMAAVAVAGLMLVDAWPAAMPLHDPPRASDIAAADLTGPLVVVPILNEFNEVAAMYRSIAQGQPVVNGYSGHMPPWYLTLRESLNDLDPAALEALARAGVRHVSVVKRQDGDGTWRQFVATRADPGRESADAMLFTLRPAGRLPAPGAGVAVAIADVRASHHPEAARNLIDGRHDTWWYTMGPQSGGEVLEVLLQSPALVSGLELTLADAFAFPRELQVDVRSPTGDWTTAWSGRTASLALDASLRSQRTLAPMVIEIGAREVTAVRLRQTGQHRRAAWTMAELRVLAR